MTKTKAKKYTQLVLVEFNNSGPFIEKFVSNKPIDMGMVHEFIEKRDGFDEDRDSITFVDDPTETVL